MSFKSRLSRLEAKNPPGRGAMEIYEELPDLDGPPMYRRPDGVVCAYEDIPGGGAPFQGIRSIVVHLPRGTE